MKQVLKFAAMTLALALATAANADVRNHMGTGSNEAQACNAAKSDASKSVSHLNMRYLGRRDVITGYSRCDCARSQGGTYYTCYVDAYVRSESK